MWPWCCGPLCILIYLFIYSVFIYLIILFYLLIIYLFAQVACACMASIECAPAVPNECALAALIGCAALAPPLPVRAASTTRHTCSPLQSMSAGRHACRVLCLRTVPAAGPVLGSYANAPGGGLRGVAVNGTRVWTRANTYVVYMCVYIIIYILLLLLLTTLLRRWLMRVGPTGWRYA